jgi:hypothetical protein
MVSTQDVTLSYFFLDAFQRPSLTIKGADLERLLRRISVMEIQGTWVFFETTYLAASLEFIVFDPLLVPSYP